MSVINPYTGRKIKIGGATYKSMPQSIQNSVQIANLNQNSSVNKFLWRDICPYSQSEREEVAKKCTSEKCFLRPKTLGYPVCPKIKISLKRTNTKEGNNTKECQPHCLGINAAYKRARQYKEQNIADKAMKLKVEFNC